MPYGRLHSYAWTDAVIGAAALAFVCVTFLLVVLIGEMFHLIGIDLIRDLLNGEWFGWMLAGAAFGGAVGLLRERDRLVATQIGRASCRARGCQYVEISVVAVPLKKKTQQN